MPPRRPGPVPARMFDAETRVELEKEKQEHGDKQKDLSRRMAATRDRHGLKMVLKTGNVPKDGDSFDVGCLIGDVEMQVPMDFFGAYEPIRYEDMVTALKTLIRWMIQMKGLTGAGDVNKMLIDLSKVLGR